MAPRASRDVWIKRVERWKDSGLTAKEFAAEIGVNPSSLNCWSWRLRAEARKSTGPKVSPAFGESEVRFLPVVASESPSQPKETPCFELVVRQVVLRVPPTFDAGALERLLRVVEAAS